MQVTETLNEGLKRAYSIKLTAAELDTKVTEKLHEAQPDVEMKGFRKGKVPLALLKRQFGQRIMGEAMQETIDGAMSKHFEDSGDRPAMQPNVEMKEGEKWKEGEELPDGISVGDNKLDDGNTIPDYQGIDQSKLVPLLTKALQEAISEIDTLKAKVTALEGK